MERYIIPSLEGRRIVSKEEKEKILKERAERSFPNILELPPINLRMEEPQERREWPDGW